MWVKLQSVTVVCIKDKADRLAKRAIVVLILLISGMLLGILARMSFMAASWILGLDNLYKDTRK